jgi:outer membrane immunogenic protein
MKKLLISSIATLGLLGTSASAADMAVKASPPAPVAAPWSWTGFYVGVNAGGSIGRNTTNNNFVMGENFPESFTVSPAGFAGGGQIGYNWQFSPSWLFGVEGDVQGLDQKETAFPSLMNSLQRSSKTGSRRRALGSDTLTAIGYGTSPAAAPGETSSRPLA